MAGTAQQSGPPLKSEDEAEGDRARGQYLAEMSEDGDRMAVGTVVLLLVLAVTFAASPDDPPLLVKPYVSLAFPTGEGAGGKLLDQTPGWHTTASWRRPPR